MKGLQAIPQAKELLAAYERLQFSGDLTPEELARFSQWSRFDPRLAEIWVAAVLRHWESVNPIAMHDKLREHPWPAVVGVLLDFVKKDVTEARRRLFDAWSQAVIADVERANWEQFFIGLRAPGGKLMVEDATYSLSEYKRWGYLGREILFNKAVARTRPGGSLAPDTRERILRELIGQRGRLTVALYWTTIGKVISRRQAERDLAACRLLRAEGRTKGRVFVKV